MVSGILITEGGVQVIGNPNNIMVLLSMFYESEQALVSAHYDKLAHELSQADIDQIMKRKQTLVDASLEQEK